MGPVQVAVLQLLLLHRWVQVGLVVVVVIRPGGAARMLADPLACSVSSGGEGMYQMMQVGEQSVGGGKGQPQEQSKAGRSGRACGRRSAPTTHPHTHPPVRA